MQPERKGAPDSLDFLIGKRAFPKLEEKVGQLERACRMKTRLKAGSEMNLLAIGKSLKGHIATATSSAGSEVKEDEAGWVRARHWAAMRQNSWGLETSRGCPRASCLSLLPSLTQRLLFSLFPSPYSAASLPFLEKVRSSLGPSFLPLDKVGR
ncbi:uncharacterized protein LOC112124772 isoform X1 [Terrapene carolina triunguis]|uniref:uncharacterized protein LOC112124772 isoform X1 n=1 Tax=Terrapene triunguis TaxID=2587831 RepID=UPI0011565AC4|nr:uncharacterized protein LOC112124772 isoform X1 [Terrapene carolina triunguis]